MDNFAAPGPFDTDPSQYGSVVGEYAKKKALLDLLRGQQVANLKNTPNATNFHTSMPHGQTSTGINLGGILGNAAQAYQQAKIDKELPEAQAGENSARYDALMRLVGNVPAGQELSSAQNIALAQMGLDPNKFDPAVRARGGGGVSGTMQEYAERERLEKAVHNGEISREDADAAIRRLDIASNQFKTLATSGGYGVVDLGSSNGMEHVTTTGGGAALPVNADPNVAGANAAHAAYGTTTGGANAQNDLTADNAALTIPRLEQGLGTLDTLSKSWLGNSGLGGDVANAAAYVGVRPKAVQDQQAAAGQLEQMAVALAPYATKFSGAQSDADVRNYTAQMGIITDKAAGIDRRIAAVRSAVASLKKLQANGFKGPDGRVHNIAEPAGAAPVAAPAAAAPAPKMTDADVAAMDPNAPGVSPENAAYIRAAKLRMLQQGATK